MYIFNKSNIAYGRKISSAFNYLINIMDKVKDRQDTYGKRFDRIQAEANIIEIQNPETVASAIPLDYIKRFIENVASHKVLNGLSNARTICIHNPNQRLRYAFFNIPTESGYLAYDANSLNGNLINELYCFDSLNDIPSDYVFLFKCYNFGENLKAVDLSDRQYGQTQFGKLSLSKVESFDREGIYLLTGQNNFVVTINGNTKTRIPSTNTYNYTTVKAEKNDIISGTYSDIYRYEDEQ